TICNSLGIPSSKMIAGFAFWFIFLTALVSALTQAGINTDFIMSNLSVILAGGVFAFALGYGIASKDMMANFLASFYTKDKFKIGDRISIEGISGEIIDIDSNSILLQSDRKKVVIPLQKLSAENVIIHEDEEVK
ncbi:MAG: mechanosensitive ion channel domain-containing protein, partial [Bacteroidota bacterium]